LNKIESTDFFEFFVFRPGADGEREGARLNVSKAGFTDPVLDLRADKRSVGHRSGQRRGTPWVRLVTEFAQAVGDFVGPLAELAVLCKLATPGVEASVEICDMSRCGLSGWTCAAYLEIQPTHPASRTCIA
jgi:hypothetical protein